MSQQVRGRSVALDSDSFGCSSFSWRSRNHAPYCSCELGVRGGGLQVIPARWPRPRAGTSGEIILPPLSQTRRHSARGVILPPGLGSSRDKIRLAANTSLDRFSKQGDRYLRRILVVGAHSVLRRAKHNPQKYPWLTQLLARRPFKVVAIALANKMARIAWALLASGGHYRPRLAAA